MESCSYKISTKNGIDSNPPDCPYILLYANKKSHQYVVGTGGALPKTVTKIAKPLINKDLVCDTAVKNDKSVTVLSQLCHRFVSFCHSFVRV